MYTHLPAFVFDIVYIKKKKKVYMARFTIIQRRSATVSFPNNIIWNIILEHVGLMTRQYSLKVLPLHTVIFN